MDWPSDEQVGGVISVVNHAIKYLKTLKWKDKTYSILFFNLNLNLKEGGWGKQVKLEVAVFYLDPSCPSQIRSKTLLHRNMTLAQLWNVLRDNNLKVLRLLSIG